VYEFVVGGQAMRRDRLVDSIRTTIYGLLLLLQLPTRYIDVIKYINVSCVKEGTLNELSTLFQ
jgi:hypothetical protein